MLQCIRDISIRKPLVQFTLRSNALSENISQWTCLQHVYIINDLMCYRSLDSRNVSRKKKQQQSRLVKSLNERKKYLLYAIFFSEGIHLYFKSKITISRRLFKEVDLICPFIVHYLFINDVMSSVISKKYF